MITKQSRFNLFLGLLMAAAYALYALSQGSGDTGLALTGMGLLLLTLFMLTYAGMGDAQVIERLRTWIGDRLSRAILPSGILLLIGWLYVSLTTGMTGRDWITSTLYMLLPTLLLWSDRHGPQRFTWQTLAAFLIFWWMIELKLLPYAKVPPGEGIGLFNLLAFNVAIYSFLVVRGLQGVGYRLLPDRRDWRYACTYLGVFFTFFALPIGLATEFVRPTEVWRPIWQFPVLLLGIFFFTGIPEEFVFRGLLHNLLRRSIPGRHSEWIALAISSVIFGFAHANNPEPPLLQLHLFGFEYVVPWVYLVLATVAGWFYGLAYIRTKSILAAALMHAMVDGWWGYFFGG